MPKITSSPQSLSPSIKGSTPVSEVLNRIQVRDPHHEPSGIYGRRVTDFESRNPMLESTAFFVFAAFVVGALMSVSMQKMAEIWVTQVMRPFVSTPLQAPESLIVPKDMHPLPQSIRKPSDDGSKDARLSPEGPHARFMGSRTLELQWDSMGEGFVYRLYASADRSMKNAQPLTEEPVQAPHMAWTPDDGIQNAWIAVKGIDSNGHETSFSDALLVRLPS